MTEIRGRPRADFTRRPAPGPQRSYPPLIHSVRPRARRTSTVAPSSMSSQGVSSAAVAAGDGVELAVAQRWHNDIPDAVAAVHRGAVLQVHVDVLADEAVGELAEGGAGPSRFTGSARGSGTALGGAGAAVLGAPRAGFAASELGAVEESLGRPTALWAEDLPGDR